MPAVHVRDVPASVLTALKERAERNGHSVQQELRDILAAAAAERPVVTAAPELTLRTVRTSGTTTWSREEMYDDGAR
ncbi:FitA-like ribbon-helix-helix domain-containing protein [Aquipuribacter nitratireducens]|uniref:Antitoxin FitA-like ribbon-helix-helix domain-containing protein n=1 Tax=Aquipuribacter nitratireducens TaxID=650104 RepID=A0ABW0GRC7_9MICO